MTIIAIFMDNNYFSNNAWNQIYSDILNFSPILIYFVNLIC